MPEQIQIADRPAATTLPAPQPAEIWSDVVQYGVKTHRGGQGFHSTSFKDEYAVVNTEWVERHILSLLFSDPSSITDGSKVKWDCTTVHKILSPAAQAAIHMAHQEGKYTRRNGACEPPYMAPSESTEDYSRVRIMMSLYPHG